MHHLRYFDAGAQYCHIASAIPRYATHRRNIMATFFEAAWPPCVSIKPLAAIRYRALLAIVGARDISIYLLSCGVIRFTPESDA